MLLRDLFTSLFYMYVLCREPHSLPELSPSLNSKCPKPNSPSLLPEGSHACPPFPGSLPLLGARLLSSKFNPGLFQPCPLLWLLPYLSLHPFTCVFILLKNRIYFWLSWVLLLRLGYLSCSSRGPRFLVQPGFSRQRLLLLKSTGSRVFGLQ